MKTIILDHERYLYISNFVNMYDLYLLHPTDYQHSIYFDKEDWLIRNRIGKYYYEPSKMRKACLNC